MKRNAIGVEDAVLLDNKLWFILSDYKCLVSMDIETKETKSYTIPSGDLYTQKRAYASIVLVGRKIYLIPFFDRVLFQFDVDSEEFMEVALDNKIVGNKSPLFLGVGVCRNYLFVMGVNVPIILRVNTVNNRVDYISDWYQDVERLIFDNKDAFFRKQSVVVNDKLYVPFCNANAVLEIDCDSMKTVVHRIGEEKHGYSGICYDGESVWLSPRKNGNIVKWDLTTNHIKYLQIMGLRELGDTITYVGIIACDNKILLLPAIRMKEVHIEVEKAMGLNGVYSGVQDNANHIIIYERNNGIFTIIDKKSYSKSDIDIGKVFVDIERVMNDKKNVVTENMILDVNDFVRYIQEKK